MEGEIEGLLQRGLAGEEGKGNVSITSIEGCVRVGRCKVKTSEGWCLGVGMCGLCRLWRVFL